MSKKPRNIPVLVVGLAFTVALGAEALGLRKALAKKDVLQLLQNSVAPERIEDLARQYRIDFPMTDETESQLRDAGSTEDLIEVLREIAPKPPSPPVLEIHSAPGHAEVYVDDVRAGTTSSEGMLIVPGLSPGEHRVRVSLEGYRDYEESAELGPGRSATVTASLESAKPLAPSKPTSEPPLPVPAPHPVEGVRIPAGTVVTVVMIDGIDSARNRAGEEFAATVDAPVVVGDRVVIPRGSGARVRLVESPRSARGLGGPDLEVQMVELNTNGTSYPVESSASRKVLTSQGTRTAETVGGGAQLGALIGRAIGRGKGAAIGASDGSGAQANTKGKQVKIPPEAKIDFTLKSSVTVTL